ncbi:MAG: DUF2877 domain-containing protein [Nocardioidaceae bacterium]
MLVAPLLDGPHRPLTVAHRSRLALQLADEQGRVVLGVMFPGAVRLPYGCAVASSPSTSSSLSVGDGVLSLGDDVYTVARWWRPSRPRHRSLAGAVDPDGVRRLAEQWRRLLGRGPGLTPYGDDVLCGALVMLHAVDHPSLPALRQSIGATALETSTTATSVSLLRAACEGWCIDELADHLAAVARGGPASTSTRAALMRVGSSSGAGLLEGLALVAPTIDRQEAA